MMKPKKTTISGDRYNRLTAIRYSHKVGYNKYWLFKCDCGTDKVTRLNSVRAGIVKSCGCLNRERLSQKGSSCRAWKGDDAGYGAIHEWVRKNKGVPGNCEMCGSNVSRNQWANIDHEYKRDIDYYISLCPSCHKKHDILKFGVNVYTNSKKRVCLTCGKEFMRAVSIIKLGGGKYCSNKCKNEKANKKTS